jgi:prepilin peptidase CpaA
LIVLRPWALGAPQVLEFITFACLGISVALLFGAALHDAATRTIPNAIPMGLAAIGIIQRLRDGQLLIGIAAAVILLVLLGFLWLRGFVGGGDVKLISAASLVMPSSSVPSFVLAVAMAGGVLALLYWALSNVTPRPRSGPRVGLVSRLIKAELWRLNRRGPLPYAVAISAGALLMIGKTFSG